MMRPAMALLAISCLALCACVGGPVRRVSQPSANIQQLTVRPDGSWSLDLRLDNFSSVPMRFDGISLAMTLGGEPAATLQARPALSIGPESADIATIVLVPSPAARIVIADTLARRGSVDYILAGTLQATPEKGRLRSYDIKRNNALSPVPGLAGVLR